MGERTLATVADPVMGTLLLLTVLWMILKLVFLVSLPYSTVMQGNVSQILPAGWTKLLVLCLIKDEQNYSTAVCTVHCQGNLAHLSLASSYDLE